MTSSNKKHFLFLRRMVALPKGEWGGLEKLMFDWLQRIDYKQANATVIVTRGWRPRFEQEAQKYNLPLQVLEFPFDFTDNYWQRFCDMFALFKSLHPAGIVFFQAWYNEFNLADLFAGNMLTGGQVYMHENLGPLSAPERTTKKYFGFLPSLELWRHFQKILMSARAFLCKKILTVSQDIQKKYISSWGYPPSKVQVTYHGADAVHYSPSKEMYASMRQKLGVHLQDTVFITTARFTQQKCLDRAIKAFGVLCEKQPNLRLFMAGNGPLEQQLKDLAQSLPCKERITFLGNLKDPADYLKMSDIFVLSSDNEGLSLALLEAMSTGLLCVSTNCTGSGEVIENGVTGYLTEISLEGVTQGMRKAASLSAQEKQKMSAAARALIVENFEINKNIAQQLTLMGIPCLKTL